MGANWGWSIRRSVRIAHARIAKGVTAGSTLILQELALEAIFSARFFD
jgi:hypothetical protein